MKQKWAFYIQATAHVSALSAACMGTAQGLLTCQVSCESLHDLEVELSLLLCMGCCAHHLLSALAELLGCETSPK